MTMIERELSLLDSTVRWDTVQIVPIIWRKQSGPTCGLAALEFANSAPCIGNRAALEIIRQRHSTCICAESESFLRPPFTQKGESLLEYARRLGWTQEGEMFCSLRLGVLAEMYFEFEWILLSIWAKEDIRAVIEAGGLLLIPYDRDANNRPCMKSGRKAHWLLVHGFAKSEGGEIAVVCSHGMSQRQLVCLADELMTSCANLDEFGGGAGMVLPSDGKMHLKNTAVVLWKK